MIKEIGCKKDNEKNEKIYSYIDIDINIKSPTSLSLELLTHFDYYHNCLKNTSINILNKPKKIIAADWMAVNGRSDLICVSKKFKDIFEGKLKGYWYSTNNENYFIFLLNNCIDGLDETKTEIVNNEERPYWYQSIENETFKSEIINNEYLFSIKQEPFRRLSTSLFEDLYKKNNLTGIQFYKDINLKRKNGNRFDGMRFGSYDDDGNRLDQWNIWKYD